MSAPDAKIRRRDWLVVAACFACQIGMGVGAYLFPVFLKPIAEELGWSRTTYAIAHPIMSTAVALVGPLVGWLSERRGPRVVLAVGGILMGAALYAAGRMATTFEFYTVAVAIGVAVACLGDLPTAAAISSRFRSRQGIALGLVYIGSNVGGAIGVLVGARLAAAGSWRDAFAAIAVGVWVLVLPSAASIGRPARSATARGRSAVDAEPDPGDVDAEGTTEGSIEGGIDGGVEGGTDGGVEPRAALRTRDFWLLFAALFAFYFYRLGVNTHLVAVLSDLGYSQGEAALGFGTTLALGIVGKLCAGGIADRIGVRSTVIGNFLGLFAASCLLLSASDARSIPLFLILHGVTTAAEDVVVPLLIARRFGVRHLARIYGLLLLALVPGGYAGPILAGRVFDQTGSYGGVFALFAVTNLGAVAAIWAVASSRRHTA